MIFGSRVNFKPKLAWKWRLWYGRLMAIWTETRKHDFALQLAAVDKNPSSLWTLNLKTKKAFPSGVLHVCLSGFPQLVPGMPVWWSHSRKTAFHHCCRQKNINEPLVWFKTQRHLNMYRGSTWCFKKKKGYKILKQIKHLMDTSMRQFSGGY